MTQTVNVLDPLDCFIWVFTSCQTRLHWAGTGVAGAEKQRESY
jgi:hypothetical protein